MTSQRLKGYQLSENQIKYIFPRDIQRLKSVADHFELNHILKEMMKELNIPVAHFPYNFAHHQDGGRIYANCKFCKSSLRYSKKREGGSNFQLNSYALEHCHGRIGGQEYTINFFSTVYTDLEIAKEKVEEKLEELSGYVRHNDYDESMGDIFKGKLPETFNQLIEILKRQNIYYFYEPINFQQQNLTFPDTIMIITPQMKQTFLSSARSIGFDFTFSLIRDRPIPLEGRKPEFMIGMIAGLNGYRRLTLYAFVISNKQTGEAIFNIFKHFIIHMGKQPQTIVTDQAFGMLAGLRKLKKEKYFNGQAYWDTFHVLKNYKFRHTELKRLMQSMIKEKSKIKFQEMYLQAVKMANTEEELDAVHKFMFESKKYCISQLKQKLFVGICVSDSHNQMVNNLIKNHIPYELPYTHVAAKIIQFSNQRNKLSVTVLREMCRVEEVFGLASLKFLRYSLSFKVYRFVFGQISKSSCCQIAYADDDLYIIEDTDSTYFVTLKDKSSSDVEQKLQYECTCEFQGKTGVPCSHIIKVLFRKHQDNIILNHIDPYYVIEDPTAFMECIYDLKCSETIIKPGMRKGRPTVFLHSNYLSSLPKGIVLVEPYKRRKGAVEKQIDELLEDPDNDGSEEDDGMDQRDLEKSEEAEKEKNINQHYRAEKMKKYFSDFQLKRDDKL